MLVSVIIPAYNCAAYLPDALESLLGQTMGDFEVLAVDDGSTDQTRSILEDFARRDPRIRVFTVENGGPARARNLGICQAHGKYLCFMDSDDRLEPELLSALSSLAEAHCLDMVACGYWMEELGEHFHQKEFSSPALLAESPEAFRRELTGLIEAHLMYVVWNKLYRTSLIRERGILFADYLSGEDRIFNSRVFPWVERFGLIERPLYHYYIRGMNTLANRYVDNRFQSVLACHEALSAAYRDMNLEGECAALSGIFVKGVMSCFTQLCARECSLTGRERLDFIRETLRHPQVREAAAFRGTGYGRIVNSLLRQGRPLPVLWLAWSVFQLQTRFHSLYLRLKHGRSPRGEESQ